MSRILPLNEPAGSSPVRAEIGRKGEDLAAQFLERQGYRLVTANFKAPVGRNSKGVQTTGEIDLIALDGDTLCFIEVKTRSSEDFAPVITAVDRRKQRQITRTARVYRKIFGLHDVSFRFDVVTVLRPDDRKPEIELKKGFWQESSFRKRSWNHQIW